MCGIFGALNHMVDEKNIEAALESMKHRGPDDMQFYQDNSSMVSLGHVRLSIIDLENGRQPLYSEDKNIILVCNGEIYDFENIREQLFSKGHRFKTKSDSEVIIHLYEEYGLEMFEQLRGEFAFILYDKKSRRTIVAKDRFGIKPLYYCRAGKGLVFSSEIKGMFSSGCLKPEICATSIRSLISGNVVPSVFKHVKSVPPGCYLIFDHNRNEFDIREYWNLNFPKSDEYFQEGSIEDLNSELRKIYESSIRLRMRSDVPVGVYLSGGVDSSSIAAEVTKHLPDGQKLKTFSVSFEADNNHQEFNEAVLARKMATHIGSDHYEIKVRRMDLLNNLEKSLWHSEYPSPNLHGIAKFILSKEASKHVKVVLTGEGADELFLGYEWFREDDDFAMAMVGTSSTKAHRKSKSLKLNLGAQEVFDALGFLPLIDMKVLLSKSSQWLYTRLFHQNCRKELEGSSTVESIIESVDLNQVEGRDNVVKIQYFTIKTTFANYILTLLGDRQEMSHSIEGRPPILDHHIFEFAKLIPNKYKICNGVEKYIFKEMVKGEVLPEIIKKRKWPFTAPPISVGPWGCLEMRHLFWKYLSYKSIKASRIFSYRYVMLILFLSKVTFRGTKLNYKMNSLMTIILSVQIISHLFVENKFSDSN